MKLEVVAYCCAAPFALPKRFASTRYGLLGDGDVDDSRQICVGHRGAHQGLQALELLAQLGAGGEADLVAAGGEGLHDSWAGRRGHPGLERDSVGLEIDSVGLNSGRPESRGDIRAGPASGTASGSSGETLRGDDGQSRSGAAGRR